MSPRSLYRHWIAALCLTIPLLAWDAAGLDMPLARLVGNEHGFAWRDHWLLTGAFHQGGRGLAWMLALWLLVGCWRPTGFLRRVPVAARLVWLAATLAGLLLINLFKYASQTSCPWDLAEFGGVARHLSHWVWGISDGGPGRCFPAGHASAGFAFLGGYFAFKETSPRLAWRWLAGASAAGLALGIGQQLRGAHFMSHTLWTGWLCWIAALLVQTLAVALARGRGAPCLREGTR